MKKQIKRNVKHIEIGNSVVKLELNSSGKNKAIISSLIAFPFIVFGLLFWFSLDVISSGLLFIGLGIFLLVLASRSPYYEWIEFDQGEQTMRYCFTRLVSKIINKTDKPQSASFKQIRIYWNAEELRQTNTVRIVTIQNVFWLVCSKEEHNRLMDWYSNNYTVPETLEQEVEVGSPGLIPSRDSMGHASMLNEIASWGRSSLLLGVIHIVASGLLNPGWGVTLLAVGGLSFIFKEASMFIMYAVTLIWVGISNIISLDIGPWTFFGAYQIYLGAKLFKKYRHFRDYEQQHLNSLEEIPANYKLGRAQKFFPWTGSLLSGLGLVVYVGVWLAVFVAMVVAYDETQDTIMVSDSLWTIFDLVGGVALGLGIVGLGLSISSVASKYKPKFIVWAGVVMGSLLVIVEVAIRIWNLMGG